MHDEDQGDLKVASPGERANVARQRSQLPGEVGRERIVLDPLEGAQQRRERQGVLVEVAAEGGR